MPTYLSIIPFLLLLTYSSPPTYEEITVDLKNDIMYYLKNIGPPFTVGNLVRYGFHTCVTGCDGCINLNDPNNAGLTPSYNATIQLYNDNNLPSNIIWSQKINNLADFWAITSTLGNFIALPNGRYIPNFTFYVGRKACPTSPNENIFGNYPDPTQGLASQSQVFGEIFNITQPEYIALIGGHTLGRAHSNASGFDNLPWTLTETILDNTFYQDIITKSWINVEAQANKKYEFEIPGIQFMFNSDICIYKDLDPYLNITNGKVSCNYNDCPVRPVTKNQVYSYASNNTLWLNDYAKAWNIMMVAGVNKNELTQILPKKN